MEIPRLVVPVALVGIALAAPTAFADRPQAIVPLGVAGSATVAAGDVATVAFLVTQGPGRKLEFAVRRAKKSRLVPDVRVIAPDGAPFDLATNGGKVSAPGAAAWTAVLPDVPQTGLWRLEVRGAGGSSGGFTALVKGRDTIRIASSKDSPPAIQMGGKLDVPLVAGENVVLAVKAKRGKRSTLVPRLQVLDADGVALGEPVSGDAKTGALRLPKGFRLPVFGQYTLRFTGAAAAGGAIAYSISTAPARPKGALPTAVAGDAFEAEPTLVARLDGSSSRPAAGGALAYRWVQVGGPRVALSGADTSLAAFTAPELPPGAASTSLAFQLSVVEGAATSKPTTVAVEIARRPLADAGRSQSVVPSALVALDGSGSLDRRGVGLRYRWTQIPGDATVVALAGADTSNPTFAAPATPATLRFALVVDDRNARSFADTVTVQVGDATKTVADAGREQYVPRMADVRLSGLATRDASGVLAGDSLFSWTQVQGPAVALAGADTAWPSFTAPRSNADLLFRLTTAGGLTDEVWVRVRATETNLPPSAKAVGPLVAAPGPVALSATGDVDPPPAGAPSFRWAQVAGAAAPVSAPGSAAATATIPAGDGQYLFAVHANDGLQYGAPDVVAVRSPGFVGAPSALAGPDRTATPGVVVALDGRDSTGAPPATPLTYQWTQISGRDWFDVTAAVPTFDPTAAAPSFALPTDVGSLTTTRTLLFRLVVSDGVATSLPDLVAVTFTGLPLDARPVVSAHASDENPLAGESVTLTAAAFDRDGDPLTFRWTQTGGPPVALSPDAASLTATFTAPASGTPTFRFVANDGFLDSAPATVAMVVDAKPTAVVIVTPSNGPPGTSVTMNGSTSADPEGRPITHAWTQTSGAAVSFDGAAPTIAFVAPAGPVAFRLVVHDGRQSSDAKTATFAQKPPPTVVASASPVDATYGAAYGATVTLTATPGTSESHSYSWRVVSLSPALPTISLSSTTARSPTFFVPSPSTTPFGQGPQAVFGVTATDPESGQTSAESQVTVRFFASFANRTSSQTASNVYAILVANNCTVCHSGSNNSTTSVGSGINGSGYGIEWIDPPDGVNYFLRNSLNVTQVTTGGSKKRLPPQGQTGRSIDSYVLDRIKGIATPRMPTVLGFVPTEQQNVIQDWIDQGSQNN